MSEIARLASQLATQNCLGCYSKLNVGSKFHAEVATHLPHLQLRTLYMPWILLLLLLLLLKPFILYQKVILKAHLRRKLTSANKIKIR